MKTFVFVFALYDETKSVCNIMLVMFQFFPPVRPCCMKSEGWPVVGFYPHVGSMGVFGINLNNLYPRFWSFKEVFSVTNQAIRLFGFIIPT